MDLDQFKNSEMSNSRTLVLTRRLIIWQVLLLAMTSDKNLYLYRLYKYELSYLYLNKIQVKNSPLYYKVV